MEQRVMLGGISLGQVDAGELLTAEFAMVMPVNSVMVVEAGENERFRAALSRWRTTVDGQVLKWLVNLLPGGDALPKTSGSALVFELLRQLEGTGRKVVLIGGAQAANAAAVQRIAADHRLPVEGFSPMLSRDGVAADEEEVLRKLAAMRPDILLVAFGAPKQEIWMDRMSDQFRSMGVRLAVACGGTVDMIAGTLPRCPPLVQRLGMEGFYRLAIEPKWFRVKRLLDSMRIFGVYTREVVRR